MSPTNVIARLLFAYWVMVGFANLVAFDGLGLEGFGELVGYVFIGALFYFVTIRIGRLASRFRRAVGGGRTSRWR